MDTSTFRRLLTLAGAPLVWMVHFLACYVIVSLACASSLHEVRVMGLSAVQLGIAASTLVAGALIVMIAAPRLRDWRHPTGPDPELSRFFAISTLLLCAISLLSMLWVAFPTSMLPTCAS
ncbi:hypothetical protein [Massilia sp. H6]|uniref:hypothetical protein n=1 Tax=Massilia sp. H6 TaxID=2970464 RepID=UPI002169B273|nr:hypothetical protein [Massilia sp. H6]UVW29270.1 hypothetical protein NRS07_03725 [Massilia sp. H6]